MKDRYDSKTDFMKEFEEAARDVCCDGWPPSWRANGPTPHPDHHREAEGGAVRALEAMPEMKTAD